jgi:hypothetical protein
MNRRELLSTSFVAGASAFPRATAYSGQKVQFQINSR